MIARQVLPATTPYAFSDGSPLYEAAAAVALFALCAGLARIPVVARVLDACLVRLAGFLRRRGLFTADDPSVAQRRIELLRIGVGGLAAWSTSFEVATAALAGDPSQVGLQSAAFGLSLLLAVGLGTPVVALGFALVLNLLLDNLTRSSNLGSMVLAMNLIAFAFLPAGRAYSVDAWLVRRAGPVGTAWRRLFAMWGPFSLDRAALVTWLAFVSFAAISFHAALAHLGEVAWRSGAVNVWILLWPVSNPRFFSQIDALYREAPALYVGFARLSAWGALFWELSMLPLALLGPLTRAFVIAWGAIFFLVGALVLPLRMLGWYELVLWALVFWVGRSAGGTSSHDTAPEIGGTIAPRPSPDASIRSSLAPRASRHAEAAATDFDSTLALRAYVLCAVVLLVAYLVRLPYVRDLPLASGAAAWSTTLIGQAPLVLGIGPVSVYNQNQLDRRLRSIAYRWTDGAGAVGDNQAVARALTPIDRNQASLLNGRLAATDAVCGDRAAFAYFASFGDRYADIAVAPRPRERFTFVVEFIAIEWPTLADVESFRYRPVEPVVVCRLESEVGSGRPPRLSFTERGADILASRMNLPFRPDPDGADLLYRFPCDAEAERLAWWFDRPNLAPRSPDALRALRVLLAELPTKHPVSCFAQADAVLAQLPVEWSAAHPPPAGAPCAPDLASAEVYVRELSDDPLAGVLADPLARARSAAARGDDMACLLAAAEVRRSYLDALR